MKSKIERFFDKVSDAISSVVLACFLVLFLLAGFIIPVLQGLARLITGSKVDLAYPVMVLFMPAVPCLALWFYAKVDQKRLPIQSMNAPLLLGFSEPRQGQPRGWRERRSICKINTAVNLVGWTALFGVSGMFLNTGFQKSGRRCTRTVSLTMTAKSSPAQVSRCWPWMISASDTGCPMGAASRDPSAGS